MSGRNAQQAHDRFQQGRLAGAVGADQGDDLAGADLEVDRRRAPGNRRSGRPARGSTAAVRSCLDPHVDALDLGIVDDRRAAAPSAIFSPKFSTIMRSATASSACSTCSIQTIVTPLSRMRRISADERLAFIVGQPAGDLVEKQQLRAGGERARQFQPLAVEQRQRARPMRLALSESSQSRRICAHRA